MPRYSYLLLDADGTLFDFAAAQHAALELTFEDQSIRLTRELHDLYSTVNEAQWKRFERGEITSGEVKVERFRVFAAEAGVQMEPELASKAFVLHLGEQRQLLPGALEVVEQLGQLCTLVLATNGLAQVQRQRLSESPLLPLLDEVVISEEIGVAKPHQDFFREAFRRVGDPPRSEVLMVGDSLSSDIAGGRGYGIHTCWLSPSGSEHGAPDPPTYSISELRQLLAVVDPEQG